MFIKNIFYLKIALLMFGYSLSAQTTVSTLQALVSAAASSNQNIKMTPGVYEMENYLTPSVISNTEPDAHNRSAMITLSGSNNVFDFTGVTIEVNTDLLNDFKTKVIEFYITGNNVHIKGLTITDIGNSPTASGGQSFTVYGDDAIIEDVTLNVSGSSPYGYGDLLGKGGGSLTAMRKHSGMLIEGANIDVLGCTINSNSFGHLFFVQGGRNVLFKDCTAVAATRTTDSMLAETSGTAYNLDFEAVYPNYNGDMVITSGYTKSLSEVGFRTYGSGANGHTTSGVTLKNCTARNARVGFALEVGSPVLIENCEATGCESGYNVGDITIKNSRGDAVNGPLLYLNGDNSFVELYLMPTEAVTTVHAVATIAGVNNNVLLKKWEDQTRLQDHAILVGASRPSGSNPFSPFGQDTTFGLKLSNCTEMPIEIYSHVSASTINTNGTVVNHSSGNTIDTNNCVIAMIEPSEQGFIDESYTIPADSENLDPFYGWDSDYSSTYGFMEIDEESNQLVCTFENNGSDYIRFYWRKIEPSNHLLNSNNYPILAVKGHRPATYTNFTLNLINESGATVQFKDGKSENGVETLSHAKILEGTTDVYYWDLSAIIPTTETWKLSGFNCVDTKELDPISVMKLDYLKTFKSLDALTNHEGLLNIQDNFLSDVFKINSNPTTGKVSIHMGVSVKANVKIYGLTGSVFVSKPITNNESVIDISHLSKGIYVISIESNSKRLTKKIVKY